MNTENLITIDIDEKMTPCQFLVYSADCRFIFRTLGNLHLVKKGGTTVWDSRRGHHLQIDLELAISQNDCILFQLFLGSDRKREAFNYRRMIQGKFRSYLFDAKITKEFSFVNERNKLFEGIWEDVFKMSEDDFESQYMKFQAEKHRKVERKIAK